MLPAALMAASVAALAVGSSLGRLESPASPPVARSAWPLLGRALRPFEERAVGRSLPQLLEAMARSLRAGTSTTGAIHLASAVTQGPLGDDLKAMVARIEHGAPVEVALDKWVGERHRVQGVRLARAAIVLAARTGGSVAGAVDGVADTIRGELALQAEVRSLASQAEASALLVAMLPLAFGVIAGLADPQTLSYMTGTGLGLASLVGGLVLDAAGFVWMRRITSRVAT